MRPWYCEFKSSIRIHDYVSLMIWNFPLFVVRRYEFNVHGGGEYSVTYCIGIFGMTITTPK
jgi:hypothetical protein